VEVLMNDVLLCPSDGFGGGGASTKLLLLKPIGPVKAVDALTG
jgi:hypothetical protein